MKKLRDLGYDLLDRPPCSPDLESFHFSQFPNLKKSISGKRFGSKGIERAVNNYFDAGSNVLNSREIIKKNKSFLNLKIAIFHCQAFV